MTEKATIGFIGTGVMGESMARQLMNAGYPVHIFTRTRAKAHTLMGEGAIWEDSVTNIAKKSDIIITMIGRPEDVEDVYFNSAGLIAHAQQGAYLIAMPTSKPYFAKEI